MKTLLFLLCAARCLAASVSLEWDKNPEAEIAYTIEVKPGAELDPGEWVQIVSTRELFVTISSLNPGMWSFRLFAVTLDGTLKSDPSNVIVTTIIPETPKGFRTVILEESEDMESWSPVATIAVAEKPRAFYRIAFSK